MYDDCPDHGLPGLSVCDSCVRPLCRKCKTKGSLPRCAECQAARERDRDPGDYRPSSASAGSGKLVAVILVLLAAMLFLNARGCAPLPNITWLK